MILSCTPGDSVLGRKFRGINPKIGKYLNEYSTLAEKRGLGTSKELLKNITAGFGRIGKDSGTVGTCTPNFGGGGEIEIDILYWKNKGDLTRRALVYHEATHCICGREHTYNYGKPYDETRKDPQSEWSKEQLKENGYFEDKCSVSLMHPKMQSDECLKTHWDHYVGEMFEGCDR